MRIIPNLVVLLFLFLAFWPQSAQAQWVYRNRICIEHHTDYRDARGTSDDDFWSTNQNRPGRGVWVRVTGGGLVHYEGYTAYNGSWAGCTPELRLLDNEYHTIEVRSEAKIYTDYIKVRPSPTQGTWSFFDQILVTSYDDVHTTETPPDKQWRALAVLEWGLKRNPGGIQYETFNVYMKQKLGCYSACASGLDLWLPGEGMYRYIIAHEMGHAMSHAANQGNNSNHLYSASTNLCSHESPHAMSSKEFQSAAAVEGIAHLFAALTFNRYNESDCRFFYYKGVDWNHDSITDPYTNLNCEGAPATTQAPTPGTGDYLSWCSLTYNNRATEYDWLRFWWDMRTDQGLLYADILDIWDTANPHTWRAGDVGFAGLPYDRLHDAANSEGFGSEWDSEAFFNGVTR